MKRKELEKLSKEELGAKLSDNNESKPEQHPLLSKAIDMLDGEII